MRGGTSDVLGVVCAKKHLFNGSRFARQFSYSRIDAALERICR